MFISLPSKGCIQAYPLLKFFRDVWRYWTGKRCSSSKYSQAMIRYIEQKKNPCFKTLERIHVTNFVVRFRAQVISFTQKKKILESPSRHKACVRNNLQWFIRAPALTGMLNCKSTHMHAHNPPKISQLQRQTRWQHTEGPFRLRDYF